MRVGRLEILLSFSQVISNVLTFLHGRTSLLPGEAQRGYNVHKPSTLKAQDSRLSEQPRRISSVTVVTPAGSCWIRACVHERGTFFDPDEMVWTGDPAVRSGFYSVLRVQLTLWYVNTSLQIE